MGHGDTRQEVAENDPHPPFWGITMFFIDTPLTTKKQKGSFNMLFDNCISSGMGGGQIKKARDERLQPYSEVELY